ncbi:MAG: hypothetical protein FWG83_05080 [Oscillospiraceae bacterium]|nr:hypothetical protein [Oscillospiraceae bacterium]
MPGIKFTAKTPKEEEYTELTTISFTRKPISDFERNRIMKQVSKFGFTILMNLFCAVALYFFCRFLIHIFGLTADSDNSRESSGVWILSKLHLIFVLAALGYLIWTIVCYRRLHINPQGKSTKKTLHNFTELVLIGDDNELSNHLTNRDPKVAYDALVRMLPDAIVPDYGMFANYLTGFRTFCLELIQGHYKNNPNIVVQDDCILGTSFDKSVLSETLHPGIEKQIVHMNMSYHYAEYKQKDNESEKETAYANLKMIFEVTFVQSGEFWYLYDPMPEYRKILLTES